VLGDSGGDVDGNPADLGVVDLALAGVDPDAHVETEALSRVDDAERAPDGAPARRK
jgi:hypothetical protein